MAPSWPTPSAPSPAAIATCPPAIDGRLAAHAAATPLNRDIAAALRITEKTVAIHIGSVLKKLGAKSRTEAVTMAAARGLVDLKT